jgi:hypothetical protein
MHLGRKTTAQRLLDTLDQSLQMAQDVRPALEHLGSAASGRSTGQKMLDSLTRSVTPSKLPRIGSSKARKAGLIAAGSVAGLTAGSAGISSLRRRSERAREDS